MLLVAGAGLFARSLYNLKTLDTGLQTEQPDHVPRRSVAERLRPAAHQALLRRAAAGHAPHARRAVGVARTGGGADRQRQQPHHPGAGVQAEAGREHEPVDQRDCAGLLPDASACRCVMGREFTERDVAGAPLVAIVNETFAQVFLRRPRIRSATASASAAMNDPGAIEIVGVVKDSLYADMRQGTGDENETPRFVYTPYQQSEELNEMTVYVRAHAGDAGACRSSCARRCGARDAVAAGLRAADDGADGRRGALQRAHAGAAVGVVRAAGDGARRDRSLRRDVLHRVAPHARDRHSHRARRRARDGAVAGAARGRVPDVRRHRASACPARSG